MCVQSKGYDFEGPAQSSDLKILNKHYPLIDFSELLAIMSQHEFSPLASDLAMIGAVFHIDADQSGVRELPFTAINRQDQTKFKLAAMEGIVEWMENSALASDMWIATNRWLRQHHQVEMRFTDNCGCCIIPTQMLDSGAWFTWLAEYNKERRSLRKLDQINYVNENNIHDNNLNDEQVQAWVKLRDVMMSFEQRLNLINLQNNAA